MRIPTLLLAAILACSSSASAAEIDLAAAALTGQEASFTQRFTPKGFRNAQVESGSVVFGQLPMMRWSYVSPEEKQFVFDGTKSWFYVPADKQVTVGQIDDATKRDLPILLLSDPAARSRDFVVRETRRGSSVITTLQPRSSAPAIRNIVVTTSSADHRILRVEYDDREGNHTAFEFASYHPRSVTPELFRFAPPPGTSVVNAQ